MRTTLLKAIWSLSTIAEAHPKRGAGIMKTDRMRTFGATLVIGVALATLASACSGAPPDDVTSQSGALTFDNPPGAPNPWVYDGGNQCQGMHCCPPGMAMVGAHLGKNVFKCATVHDGFTDYTLQNTQRNNMLSCPSGYVMVGYHGQTCIDRTIFGICDEYWGEQLYCARPLDGLSFEYVDNGTQDNSQGYSMHVCDERPGNPGQYAMSGIHASTNQFECSR